MFRKEPRWEISRSQGHLGIEIGLIQSRLTSEIGGLCGQTFLILQSLVSIC